MTEPRYRIVCLSPSEWVVEYKDTETYGSRTVSFWLRVNSVKFETEFGAEAWIDRQIADRKFVAAHPPREYP